MKMTIKKLGISAAVSLWLAFLSIAWTSKGFTQVPGLFSTISWTSATGGSVIVSGISAGGYSQVNSLPSSFAGTGNASGFMGYGENATGDLDFFAANNGAAATFDWYSIQGASTLVKLMSVSSTGVLTTPFGINTQSLLSTSTVTTARFTVSTIPSAITSGAGAQLVVTDCTSFTPGPISGCVGGGADYMIAVSNGASWSVH